MEKKADVVLLGVRGSLPVSGAAFAQYGGATASVFVRMGGEAILLDGGSGLLRERTWMQALPKQLHILLSHPHIDHLLGLPACPALFDPERQVTLWAARRMGLSPQEQVTALMAPPLWPVGPDAFPHMAWREIVQPSFSIGPIQVDVMEGSHPGGVSVFRLSCDGRSLVYATDCELTEDVFPQLAEFSKNCDLLLFDAQYTGEEYASREGWGHTSLPVALRFVQAAQAKRTVFIHHDPFRTDAMLDEMAAALKQTHPTCSFGRSGEELTI